MQENTQSALPQGTVPDTCGFPRPEFTVASPELRPLISWATNPKLMSAKQRADNPAIALRCPTYRGKFR